MYGDRLTDGLCFQSQPPLEGYYTLDFFATIIPTEF